VKLTYFGHAMFLLEANGTSVLIDPYDEQCGYALAPVAAGVVVVSHEHFDHNNVKIASGSPKVIRGLRDGGKDWAEVHEQIGPLSLTTVPTYHDGSRGNDRGKNAMLIFEGEELRLVHSGDLGHTLSQEQVQALGRVDALLIPVGGHYTITATEAGTVIGQLTPRVVIPMHYKTEVNEGWPITKIDPFLSGKPRVKQQGRSVTLTRTALPREMEIWVLRHR
jgi:L-ascorbate metabolism protein UlaG (beta-lactamase superfamily)